MIIRYFIDYRYEYQKGSFIPIGVWMHNPANGDVDMFYIEPDCPEAEDAKWIINRLVEAGTNTPDDFLVFHATRAGYLGMRGTISQEETKLNYDAFAKSILLKLNIQEATLITTSL